MNMAEIPPVFMPMQVNFMVRRKNTTIILVEHKPGPKTILVNSRVYTLSLPYIYFIFVNETGGGEVYVFAGNKKIHSLNDMLYSAPLPNVFGDGSVCMGSAGGSSNPEEFIKKFWNSSFSREVNRNLVLCNPVGNNVRVSEIFKKWNYETKKDLNYWKKINLAKFMTLKEFVRIKLPRNSNAFEQNIQAQVEIAVQKSVECISKLR
jgi:hypothetical protein